MRYRSLLGTVLGIDNHGELMLSERVERVSARSFPVSTLCEHISRYLMWLDVNWITGTKCL